MLEIAGCGAAVAGALEPVKEAADIVLFADAGEGVIELIDRMLGRITGERVKEKLNPAALNLINFPKAGNRDEREEFRDPQRVGENSPGREALAFD